jgi:hypothetical protein
MVRQQFLEILDGCRLVALIGAFNGQAVPCKRIVRMSGGEFFEHLAAGLLLWLGHGF